MSEADNTVEQQQSAQSEQPQRLARAVAAQLLEQLRSPTVTVESDNERRDLPTPLLMGQTP